MQGRNLEQSEEIFSAYVELAERPPQSPSLAGGRWRLGMVYEKQGRKAEALEQYRLAAELDPEWEQPREEIERLEKELSGR
jgi:tetratricopeptide (TPR) repeat protein